MPLETPHVCTSSRAISVGKKQQEEFLDCPKVPSEVKKEIEEYMAGKKHAKEDKIPFENQGSDSEEDLEEIEILQKSLKKTSEAIGQYGSGMKPPTYHEVRVPLLKREVDTTRKIMAEHKKEWEANGCSIMSDGWTDKNQRTLINILVNCLPRLVLQLPLSL
ncbi:hypothetical protein DCAR_0831415 [Daucus carota subsp. sativus]|uniref:DUF659 domain-containing protein n=1 Tax=Daucus carota subsp. sativus TaxID=79200 RepID=A0AAF0XSE1_DAUCS|nr:hypothetical protein DCAR_0831415 [Daucus carota subsp. sativus]